ncbi:MAG: lipocalin-like domain-containing protein [Verrucomicrobiota bacterium]
MPKTNTIPLFLFLLSAFLRFGMLPACAEWHTAQPGYQYTFPADHHSHPDFKTEWWYFTGNLSNPDTKQRFGYQLTFFRQGVRPPGQRQPAASRFVTDHLAFAHFAITEIDGQKFYHDQRITRNAFDEAFFGPPGDPTLARIEDWSLTLNPDESFTIKAAATDFALDLHLTPTLPKIFHGKNGISPKSADPTNASHYFTHPRLRTEGTLTLSANTVPVTGNSWFDREWSTSALTENQVGWDWFALQLDDGRNLMLFQVRRADASPDHGSGTIIESDGTYTVLTPTDFSLTPTKFWKSPLTNAGYPVSWDLEVPSQNLTLTVNATLENQELTFPGIAYWEGAITVSGSTEGKGYLEMTGYAEPVTGLR